MSLNFARLQRLRPGYGYNTLDDLTINDNAPKDDGIFLVDLISQDSHLIIKLRDLALKVDPDFKFPHYINHISISPDGKHFIFFHVWQLENEYHWKTRLYVSDIKGKELKLLESKHKVSHYTWKNNEEILITCYDNKIQYYAIYNIHTKEKKIVNIESLNLDGHPTFFKNKELIISDTYPKKYNYQTLYIHNLKKNENRELLRLYSDPRMYGEKRCDLHPRLSPSEKYIICDSTFESGLRKIILIKNENN